MTNTAALKRLSRFAKIRNVLSLAKEMIVRLVCRNPRETIGWIRYKQSAYFRERSLGIDTRGSLPLNALGNSHTACKEYAPVDWQCFDIAMGCLNINPAQDVFLDYGAGKGRAVVLAATHPFRAVLGVEMSAELCAMAEENVRRAKDKLKCGDVRIIQADATTYSVPPQVTVIFLYNPFIGDVLAAVVERIHESLIEHPRKLKIIYMYPDTAEDVFAHRDWLVERQQLATGYMTGLRYVIHESRDKVNVDVGGRTSVPRAVKPVDVGSPRK